MPKKLHYIFDSRAPQYPAKPLQDLIVLKKNAAHCRRWVWAILFGAALFVPSLGQGAGDAPAITSTTVTLSWDKSPSRAVKGYRLRCGLTPGRNYLRIIDVGKVTTYKISNLIPGKTYYCTVTAYDAAGRESPASNEISFTVSPSALKKRK